MRSVPGAGLLLILAACWPVLAWYWRGSLDGSNDPWGLLALGTALFALRHSPRLPQPAHPLALPGVCLILYAMATVAGLPASLRAIAAALALAALGSARWRGRRLDLPIASLALLALPLTATLQFYFGYPLRLLAGWLAVVLLQLNGIAVVLDGTTFLWDGRQIAIDAPCSGIRMLWAGCYLTAAGAALFRFSPRQTMATGMLTLLVVITANAIRAAALFYLEGGLVDLPAWTHEAAGLSVFLAAGGLIANRLLQMAKTPERAAQW